MDSLKQEEGLVKTPTKGTPSILYFIDNIPENVENLKWEVTSHFQKKKRFKGGEVVPSEYRVLGPNSALLLFENAEGKLLCIVTIVNRNGTVFTVSLAWPDPSSRRGVVACSKVIWGNFVIFL